MTGAINRAVPSTSVASAQEAAPPGWQAAVDNVAKLGTYSAPEGLPETIGLRAIQGPVDGTHQADYMNLRGAKDRDGKFVTGYVTLVSEQWEKTADGNFHIDQWLHRLDPDGTGDRAVHIFLVETPDRVVLDNGIYHPTAEETAAHLRGKIDRWSHYKPSATVVPAALDQVGPQRVAHLTPPAAAPIELATPRARAGVALR